MLLEPPQSRLPHKSILLPLLDISNFISPFAPQPASAVDVLLRSAAAADLVVQLPERGLVLLKMRPEMLLHTKQTRPELHAASRLNAE
jgi:hypothetical protein|tara:strand:- start:92 stop:355 length:264 start_codon:yes stop_codon:yes gene_type:complete